MFRLMPFNLKNNADKGREFVDRMLEMAFDQSHNPLGRVSGALSHFKVDVIDADDRYEIQAELPGFAKDEITVSYSEEKYLTISAERAEADLGLKYLCRERRSGKFERSFYIDDINDEATSVSYENGLLRIVLPKESANVGKKVFDIA